MAHEGVYRNLLEGSTGSYFFLGEVVRLKRGQVWG